jgi:hypothetical protein
MTTRPSDPVSTWETLDAELARWLRTRAATRAARDRDPSPLDAVAMSLRSVRSALGTMTESLRANDQMETQALAVVSLTYRWAIRVARELESIEQLELDPLDDWTRFEAFAPFALAFYDSALAPVFAASTGRTGPERRDVFGTARLRREIDGVLASLSNAFAAAWAA